MMRRFLTTSFILLALVVAAGAAPAAYAQFDPNAPSFGNTTSASTPAPTQSSVLTGPSFSAPAADVLSGSGTTLNPSIGSMTDQAVSQNIANDKAAASTLAGGLPKDPDGSEGFGKIMMWIMALFAWLVGVAAMTLNYAVYYTVITMGDYVHKLSAIGVTWRILRDIANIMFIFGFLGAGIATILSAEKYGWGKKMLPMLLVGAVFLNFSLFITEAIIDTSNLFAVQFYSQINGGKIPTPADMANMTPSSEGISTKIMNQLGIQTIYGEVQNTGKAPKILAAGNSWIIGFMGILLFITTAFVMFSLAFILIARFIALIFFLILSPVGFMGLAIPQMGFRMNQWWGEFLKQVITAPVLLLLLYVALAVITDVQFLTGFGSEKNGPQWLGFISGGNMSGFAGMILSFLVAMGLLLMVVIKAKSMAAFGAGHATALAGKLTFGATAWGMRQTAGRGFQVASKKFNASRFSRVPGVGRAISGVLGKGATASWDARGVKAGGGLARIGVDAGKAQEGGFRAMQKASKDASKAHDTETKVGRLKNEFAKTTPNPTEISKIMRSLGDDDFKDSGVLDLIKKHPLAVQALSGHQASILPDAVIMDRNVYANLSPSQLESIRNAANMSTASAHSIGPLILASNVVFATWFAGRTGNQLADVKAFWNI